MTKKYSSYLCHINFVTKNELCFQTFQTLYAAAPSYDRAASFLFRIPADIPPFQYKSAAWKRLVWRSCYDDVYDNTCMCRPNKIVILLSAGKIQLYSLYFMVFWRSRVLLDLLLAVSLACDGQSYPVS